MSLPHFGRGQADAVDPAAPDHMKAAGAEKSHVKTLVQKGASV